MSTLTGRTKRRLLSTALLGALLFVFTVFQAQKASAQTECGSTDCTAAWSPDITMPAQTVIVVLPTGCPVAVSYRIRCCANRQEVYMSYITSADPCCDNTFSTMSVQAVVEQVAMALSQNNSLWGGCASGIRRVTQPMCWKRSSGSVVEPCSPILNCCYKEYNGGGSGKTKSSPTDCSSYPPGDGCQNICP